MPLILTCAVHDWVVVSDDDGMSTKAFRASDIRYLEKVKNENGLWSLIVYVHPANVQIHYMDAEEGAVQAIFTQLLGLAHRADYGKPCADCERLRPPTV